MKEIESARRSRKQEKRKLERIKLQLVTVNLRNVSNLTGERNTYNRANERELLLYGAFSHLVIASKTALVSNSLFLLEH